MNKNETIKKGTIHMKKLTALFLSLAMVLSLAACGASSSNENSAPETSAPSASSETQEPSAAPESTEEPSSQPETEGEAGETLVVYYSATGNTEQVANYIADITGGYLIELNHDYLDEASGFVTGVVVPVDGGFNAYSGV